MLYKIEIENFYSISEHQEIDLRARKSVVDNLGRLSPIFTGSEDRSPNVVALFGPNAAGKSNLLRAIVFAAWFVTRSFEHDLNQLLPYQKFGSNEKISEPTRLAFSFSGPADILGTPSDGRQCPYSYELVLSPRGNYSDFVILEKLSYKPTIFGKSTAIIERRENGFARFARGFVAGSLERALKAVLRPEASVICTLARLNHAKAKTFVESILGIKTNIFWEGSEGDESLATLWYASNPSAFDQLRSIGKRIDLGIDQINVDNSSAEPQLKFKHSGLDQIISLQLESHGTRQLIKILPFIQMALEQGGMAVIDDIDSAIHPLLLPEIIRWFGDIDRNPKGAELWMTCHAASLLSELTKEEILFFEKDSLGRTNVFRLVDIEGVRRDENFFGKYMSGEYGAVPILG